MATRLYGILTDGLNKPIVNATVALLAKGNTITVLNGSEAVFRTDGEGAYNISVQAGHYKVIIGPQGIEPYKAGEIVIYSDSPEGSLNGYLINWAPEELTPDVIKQVQQLVANSEEYALQAGRSAAAANADATDARNSKAAAATSASEALTYKNDSKTNADAAKQAQAGAAGSANTATQAVTTITNLKKDVEKLKSDTQTIKNNAVSETQAIKDAAVSETTALKDAAAASATKAGNSATEAGKQASNAGTSATAAKNDADRAKTEADRAETAASSTPEIQPLPDVWIPFNDSLEMITGFAPGYKKITVGDDVITMPTDKVVTFSRASTATYINKSGVLTVAEIDEPRFEKEGLLIEGQRTNYFINSNTPELWNPNPGLNRSETKTDSRGFKYATFTPGEYLGGSGTYTVIAGLTPNKIAVVKDDAITISFRAKGNNVRFAARFDKGDPLTSVAAAFIDSTTLAVSTSGTDMANIILKNVVRDGEWVAIEIVYKVTDDSTDIRGVIQMVDKSGTNFDDTSFMDLTTPQVELGSCASSFIITEGTPATRASDLVSIPTRNNLYKPPFTFLLEVHKKWDIAPNAAPRVWDIASANTGQSAIAAINRGSGKLYMSLSNPSGSYVNSTASDVFAEKTIFGCIAKADGNFHVVTNGKAVNDTYCEYNGVTADKNIRFGGQTNTGERHLFGHIRNFRIWSKELTDRQLKESV